MRRRALLATIAALSGCTAAPRVSDSTTTPETKTTLTSTPLQQCPPALDPETTVQCSGLSTQVPIRMTASPSLLDLPRDSSQFRLHNESETRLTSSVGASQLFVYSGDQWEFVLPKYGSGGIQRIELEPDETREWTFHANTADLSSLTPPASSDDSQSFTFRCLPGTYAFGFRTTPVGSDSATLYTTTFTVAGGTSELIPSESVDTYSSQGKTLTVKTQTTKEYEHSRRVSLSMERHSTSQQAASLSRFELYNPHYEQVPSYDRVFVPPHLAELLRDAFAFVNGLDEQVRVQTIDTAHPPLGLGENESLFVSYDDEAWKVTSHNGWE